MLDEVKRLQAGGEPPRLTLNKHCQVCEFRQRCRKQAEEADDISLLGGVGEKELQRYNRKGIFTLTQLSCTFRPRKRGKRVKRTSYPHYAALQALAIREKKVHVYGTPDLPRKPVQVFFDAEGDEDGVSSTCSASSWSRATARRCTPSGRTARTRRCRCSTPSWTCWTAARTLPSSTTAATRGTLLKRMRKVVTRKGLVDRTLANAVNVLSVIHASVYFPTFSNGLKESAGTWAAPGRRRTPPGLQSLVWRARWEQAREQCWKDKLLTYNAEDCAALRKVDGVRPGRRRNCPPPRRRRGRHQRGSPRSPGRTRSSHRRAARSGAAASSPSRTSTTSTAVPTSTTNGRRSSSAPARRSGGPACATRKQKKRPKLPVNREVEIRSDTCPCCKGKRITRLSTRSTPSSPTTSSSPREASAGR